VLRALLYSRFSHQPLRRILRLLADRWPILACGLLVTVLVALAVPGNLRPARIAVAAPAAQLVTAMPCVNGMAGPFPCANVDLMSFLPLATIGGASGNDVWGWTDPLTNREYALMGLDSGTAFVDITDPQNPIYLGNLPTHSVPSLWRDLEVFADHAYIVSEAPGHGMQVFDLRQLRNVVNPPATFTETAHYAGFAHAHTVAVNTQTGFAYAAGTETCSGGLHMVNIQNPASPVNAGCVSQDGYTHDAQCVIYQGPDVAHRGREVCFCSNEDTLTIVDVTDKAAPVIESRTTYSGSGYTHQGWLTTDHAFFLLDDELDEQRLAVNTRTHIWSVPDLHAPQRIGIYEAATLAIDHNQFIVGNFAFQANYRSGLRILDLTGIASANLREAAYFDIFPADDNAAFNGAWNTYPFFPSGTVVVSGIEQGLFILRPNLAGNPMGLPNYSVAATPASATVTRGQSANFTLTATPQNAFAAQITLNCSGLPAATSCTFNPAALLPAGGPASSAVMITTAASSAAPDGNSARATPAPPVAAWLLLPLCACALFFSVRRRAPLRPATLALLILLLSLSCGGGGSVAPPPPPPPPPPPGGGTGTPPGSYAITIIATSGSIRRSFSVNLVVQ